MGVKRRLGISVLVVGLLAVAIALSFFGRHDSGMPESGIDEVPGGSPKTFDMEEFREVEPVSGFLQAHPEYNISSVSDGDYENITISSEGEELFLMFAGGGSGGGSSSSSSGESSSGIPSEPCVYSYYVTGTDMQLWHINEGCSGPTPVCDSRGYCRSCSSKEECIRKVEMTAIPIGNMTFKEMKITGYNIIDTDATAKFNEIYGTCDIILAEEALFSYTGMSDSECLSQILSFAVCGDGRCGSSL